MSEPGATARAAGWRNLTLDALRRAAALVCLAAAYRCAVSGFDPWWLVILVLATLVMATGPQYWTLTEQMPAALRWPSLWDAGFGVVPGWVVLAGAAAAKAGGTSPRYVIWIWVAGAAWLLIGSWRLSRDQRSPSGDAILAQAVSTSPRVARWWTLAGTTLVLAAAVAPRFWEIGTVPRYVHADEGTITFVAQAFYADPERDWFAPPANAGSYSIMNRLIIGNTPVERNPGTDAMAYIDSVQLSGSDLFVVSGESPQVRDYLMTRYPEARLESWQRRPYAGPVLSLIFVGPPRTVPTS